MAVEKIMIRTVADLRRLLARQPQDADLFVAGADGPKALIGGAVGHESEGGIVITLLLVDEGDNHLKIVRADA